MKRIFVRTLRIIARISALALRHKGIRVSEFWTTIEKDIDINKYFFIAFDFPERDVWFYFRHTVSDSASQYSIDTALSAEPRVLLEQLRSFLCSSGLQCRIEQDRKVKHARPHLIIDPKRDVSTKRIIDLLLIEFFKCRSEERIDLYYPPKKYFEKI